MAPFIHQRHKPPRTLSAPRELIVACCPMRSNVNLARIVRTAGCCGVSRVIACGRPRLDPEIVRDALECVALETHRSLPPVLARLKRDGYAIIGIEQTTESIDIHTYAFPRRAVLVIGNERLGIDESVLALLDAAVEIPVFGRPLSYNAASAADMALYEYCRQYPCA
ncbi:MAG: RNA methyltransferase [Planctomycetes bacterium]|nr:RNA methyltransferase [Planctomycetota bacterium]